MKTQIKLMGSKYLFLSVSFCLAMLGLTGCATITTTNQIGVNGAELRTDKKYFLQKEAILLAHRGWLDSIEKPDYKLHDYRPYEHFDPYYTKPRGTLPVGTVIKVKEIRLFKDSTFQIIGEIMTGEYAREELTFWRGLKGFVVGPRPRTGKVVINNLCGGKTFDHLATEQNLTGQIR